MPDQGRLRRSRDGARHAALLLTRLPLHPPPRGMRLGEAIVWFPLVGCALGLAGGGLIALALALGATHGMAALSGIAFLAIATGALHEDGLCDFFDAMAAGGDRTRRLAIMRDSRIGAVGALALLLGVGARWAALTALVEHGGAFGGLVAGCALSRLAPPLLLYALPCARTDGLAAQCGPVSPRRLILACVLGALIGVLFTGFLATFLGALAMACALFWVARKARTCLGGVTGDVLGASQQLSEIMLLVMFSFIMGK